MAEADPDAVSDAIADSAAGPASASGDGQSVTQHPLPDQIAADKYLASKRAGAARKGFGGIRTMKISPPSSADVD